MVLLILILTSQLSTPHSRVATFVLFGFILIRGGGGGGGQEEKEDVSPWELQRSVNEKEKLEMQQKKASRDY